MNKVFVKIIAICCIVSVSISLSGCSLSKSSVFEASPVLVDGKIWTIPVKAQYNDDGSLSVTLASSNGLKYPKVIKSLEVTLTNNNDKLIAETQTFDIEAPSVISPGEAQEINCEYDKEQVLLKTSLKTIKSKVTVIYDGCVSKGDDPKVEKDKITASIKEAKLNLKNEFEGTVAIKNNYSTDKTPKSIAFTLKTDKGYVINKTEVIIKNTATLKPGEQITFPFLIAPQYLKEDISSNMMFDTMTLTYTITE